MEDGPLLDDLPVRQGIAVVDHAHVDVICLEQGQHFLHAGLHFVNLAGAHILPVFPDGAQVGLDIKFFPAALEGLAYAGPHLRVGGVQVEIVNSQFFRRVEKTHGVSAIIL